jgi:hypothetical protein
MQVDGQYVSKQVKEFNRPNVSQQYKDSALYRIGTHANLFTDKEMAEIAEIENTSILPATEQAAIAINDGILLPQHRLKVLEWLIYSAGFPIPENLALHIFGYEKLLRWRDEGKRRYPAFELVLCVRPSREYLELSCHFRPLPEAPEVQTDCDFPWKYFWEGADLFFDEEYGTHLSLTFECYPEQDSFAVPNSTMPDWMLELGDEEVDMPTVLELLEGRYHSIKVSGR